MITNTILGFLIVGRVYYTPKPNSSYGPCNRTPIITVKEALKGTGQKSEREGTSKTLLHEQSGCRFYILERHWEQVLDLRFLDTSRIRRHIGLGFMAFGCHTVAAGLPGYFCRVFRAQGLRWDLGLGLVPTPPGSASQALKAQARTSEFVLPLLCIGIGDLDNPEGKERILI